VAPRPHPCLLAANICTNLVAGSRVLLVLWNAFGSVERVQLLVIGPITSSSCSAPALTRAASATARADTAKAMKQPSERNRSQQVS